MSGVIAVVVIVLVVGGLVALTIRKILFAPISPPRRTEPEPVGLEEAASAPQTVTPATPLNLEPVVAPLAVPTVAAKPEPPRRAPPPKASTSPMQKVAALVAPSTSDAVVLEKPEATVARAATLDAAALAVAAPTLLTARVLYAGLSSTFNPQVMDGGDRCLGIKPIPPSPKDREEARLRVTVNASGRIEADGKAISLAQLKERLAEVKGTGITVWCYCERAEPEPIQAGQVLDLVLGAGVPLKLTDKSFISPSSPGA